MITNDDVAIAADEVSHSTAGFDGTGTLRLTHVAQEILETIDKEIEKLELEEFQERL